MYQIVGSSSMKLSTIYHVKPIFISIHYTRKPTTLKQIGVKRFEIHLKNSFYGAALHDRISGCVKITHGTTTISGLTLINLACTKMAPLKPHIVEHKTVQNQNLLHLYK